MPSSNRHRGLFASVDGPSAAGKSTIVEHLAQLLVAQGEEVIVTGEPSGGPIGRLCRQLTETVTGYALAALYAADRYQHVETEIRPHIEAGRTVISDRYVPSSLVMQRFDGLDLPFLMSLNERADKPDLAVILDADPEVIAQRHAARDDAPSSCAAGRRTDRKRRPGRAGGRHRQALPHRGSEQHAHPNRTGAVPTDRS